MSIVTLTNAISIIVAATIMITSIVVSFITFCVTFILNRIMNVTIIIASNSACIVTSTRLLVFSYQH